jgi:DnaK suppressor protein
MSKSERDRLLALREQIEAAADAGADSASVVELDQSKVGRLSRMDAMQAQAMAKASGQRREAMLRNIEAALKRLDAGDYGFCRDCEEPINPKRLEFDPTALRCIDCERKRES